jgi:tetratricopeptide (TPR) repeat protein
VRAWYSGRPVEEVSGGKSFAALDGEFRADLAQIQLRPQLLAMARARFDRPSIFGRVCPRRVDRDLGTAEGRLGSGDISGAREVFRGLLDLERDNTRARLGLAQCDVRAGELEAAVKRYQALATDPRLSVLERAAALEARGDVQVMADQPARAVEAYADVAKLDMDEDRQRTLEVKTLLAASGPGSGMRSLLIGEPRLGPSWDEAAPLLGAEAAAGDPLSQYLLGRNLWLHGRPEAALRYLDAALEPLPTNARSAKVSWPPALSIVRESLRLQVVIRCSQRDLDRAKASDAFRRFDADPGVPAAKKAATRRFATRCGL